MWPLFVTIIIFLMLSIYLITMFLSDFLYIMINIPLLWIILIRSFFKIRKKKIIIPYFIGLGITTLLFLLWFDFFKIPYVLWQVLFAAMVFVIAEIIVYGLYLDEINNWKIREKIINKFKKKRSKKR